MKYLAVLLILIAVSGNSFAQSPDSAIQTVDTARIRDSLLRVQKTKDSLLAKAQEEISRTADSIKKMLITKRKVALAAFQQVLKDHPYYKFYNRPDRQLIIFRKTESNDGIFYYIVGLVLYLALMRLFFL